MNLFEISCLSLHCIELDSFCLVKIGYKSTISSLPAKHVKTVNSHFVDMKSKLIVKSQYSISRPNPPAVLSLSKHVNENNFLALRDKKADSTN